MTEHDLNEVVIILDQLTLLHFKKQQLDRNKPRPENYYALYEELETNYLNTKDLLVETMINKNLTNVLEKIKGETND